MANPSGMALDLNRSARPAGVCGRALRGVRRTMPVAADTEITDMVHTVVDGAFRQTNLDSESADYLKKREDLRLAEVELMLQRERVAALRYCRFIPTLPL